MTYPDLHNIDVSGYVKTKGTGKFAADYVPWAIIANLLREHAPGWQPYAAQADDDSIAHAAPDGTYYLLIGFRHPDPEQMDTELVPHAVMDHRMDAKKNPSARDIADAYVRGMCKAAALLFGLGWRLWAKDDPMTRDDAEAPAPRKVSGFASPDEAVVKIMAARTINDLKKVWQHVAASGFLGEEMEGLAKAKDERKAQLTEESK